MQHRILERLSEENLHGILVRPFNTDVMDTEYINLLKHIKDNGIQVVFYGQYVPLLDISSVTADHTLLGYAATEHLIMLGHKQICYACTACYDMSGRATLNGYKRALTDYGIKFDRRLVIDLPQPLNAGPTHDAVIKLLSEERYLFTAIATPQFSMTYGITRALSELGLSVPDDIAVVGHETYQNPKLDFVTHTLSPTHAIGTEAVRILAGKAESNPLKHHVLLPPQLVVRESCGIKPVGGKRK